MLKLERKGEMSSPLGDLVGTKENQLPLAFIHINTLIFIYLFVCLFILLSRESVEALYEPSTLSNSGPQTF